MIKVSNISKAYGEKKVFNNFSCTFDKGVTIVMGKSGSGKTTLFRILLGLEKIDGGAIEGLNTVALSAVFQENRLFENMSIEDNISYVTDNMLNMSVVKKLGLKEYLGKRVGSLSGGTKRRVAILRALSVPFDTLIMDEPFTGLDEKIKKQAIDCIVECGYNKTIIVATHDKEAIEAFGNDKKIIEVI